VLGADRSANTVDSAENNGAGEVTSGHVVSLGTGVNDMVNSLEGKVPGHEFNDRAEACKTSTNSDSSETGFGNRSVDNAFVTVSVPHTLRNFVGSVVLSNLFTNEEDLLVTLDFVAHGRVDRLTNSHLLSSRAARVESSGLSAE